ncbi:hypothetical protein GCM10023405_31680 [Streptomonospora salina]
MEPGATGSLNPVDERPVQRPSAPVSRLARFGFISFFLLWMNVLPMLVEVYSDYGGADPARRACRWLRVGVRGFAVADGTAPFGCADVRGSILPVLGEVGRSRVDAGVSALPPDLPRDLGPDSGHARATFWGLIRGTLERAPQVW